MLFFIFTSCAKIDRKDNDDLTFYNGDIPSNEYQFHVERILNGNVQIGAKIKLGSKEYTFIKLLGAGQNTIVLDVMELINQSKVLRIPKRENMSKSNHDFLKAYNELSDSSLSIIKLYPEESDISKFLIAERIEIVMLGSDIIKENTYNESEASLNSFLQFVEEASEFVFIGDFHPGQIGKDSNNRWILFDFQQGGIKFDRNKHKIDNSPFDTNPPVNPTWPEMNNRLWDKLQQRIIDTRTKRFYMEKQRIYQSHFKIEYRA